MSTNETIDKSAGLILLMLLIIAQGCTNPWSPFMASGSGQDDPLFPDHPDKVLFNLTLSYRLLDIELYLSCLDSENFIFYFDPQDEGISTYLNNLGIYNYQWEYQEEKNSTEAIFESMKEIGEVVVPVFFGSEIYYVDSNYAILVRDYSFDPPVIHGELVRGRAIFYMTKYEQIWKITEWRDMVE
ncbi:MAG: hypothetical protein APR63_13530 [Desulfuromonas sp. SDB]|nr:MAG: hypothetical protein APR63_13530 [Desulfuromonas sp. SDB]